MGILGKRSKYKPCEHKDFHEFLGQCELGSVYYCNYCGHSWVDTDTRGAYMEMYDILEKIVYDEDKGVWYALPEPDTPMIKVDERTGLRIEGTYEQLQHFEAKKLKILDEIHELLYGPEEDHIPDHPIPPAVETLMLGYRLVEGDLFQKRGEE